MTEHFLKTWPEAFNLVLGGLKHFELRVDDRGYAVDDLLWLCEYEPFSRSFTGREMARRVTCVIRTAGPVPLPGGLVVLGLDDPSQGRLAALLHDLAALLGVKPVFGAIEEQPILDAAKTLVEALAAERAAGDKLRQQYDALAQSAIALKGGL